MSGSSRGTGLALLQELLLLLQLLLQRVNCGGPASSANGGDQRLEGTNRVDCWDRFPYRLDPPSSQSQATDQNQSNQ